MVEKPQSIHIDPHSSNYLKPLKGVSMHPAILSISLVVLRTLLLSVGKFPLVMWRLKTLREDLDRVEKSDQLKRYRQSLHNLILTNYLEFRWYVNGINKLTARVATIGKGKKLIPNSEGITSAVQLFREFYQTEVPTVGTPKDLAARMAQLTKLVRDLIIKALESERGDEKGALQTQYRTFRQYLLPTLKPDEFADIYAQTMAYGLFAACLSAPEGAPFNRSSAYQYLTSNRFLRRLFLDVGEELDETLIAPFLDDIASLLAHADMAAILKTSGNVHALKIQSSTFMKPS